MPFANPKDLEAHIAKQRQRQRSSLLISTAGLFFEKWHWFQYHFQKLPPSPFVASLLDACLALQRIALDAPERLMGELARIGGRERDENDYDQLLQKLSEILVAQQVVSMSWAPGTRFALEESAPGSPKSVDVVATGPDGRKIGFEVKAPKANQHAGRRAQRPIQVPARGPEGFVEGIRQHIGEPTLPRDNTVRDFLRSANEKFLSFKAADPSFIGVLIIVWDDFVYECLTPLANPRNGLLTPESYSRTGEGAEPFPNVDAVIVVRHLSYFVSAAAESPLPDGRRHAFHVGGQGAMPNVILSVPGGLQVPEFVLRGFNAWPYDDPLIQSASEYVASEMIMWTGLVPGPKN